MNIILVDLSFNNITRIEGLDSLTELTDLSLYNNRISTLENMDSLKKLNVFSIGNNQIDDENSVCIIIRDKKMVCMSTNSRFDIYDDLKIFERFAFVAIHMHPNRIIMFILLLIYHKYNFSIIN